SRLDHSNLRGADLQGRHLQSLGQSGQRYINAAAGELDLRSSEIRRSRSNPVAAVFHRRRRQQSAAAGAGWRHRLSAVSVPGPGSVGRGVPNGARRRRGPKAFPSGSYDLGSVLNKDSSANRVVIQGFRIGGGLDEEATVLAEQ